MRPIASWWWRWSRNSRQAPPRKFQVSSLNSERAASRGRAFVLLSKQLSSICSRTMLRMMRVIAAVLLLTFGFASFSFAQRAVVDWRTPAELTDYRTTPTYDETMEYV